jgi:flagellar protein FlaJ
MRTLYEFAADLFSRYFIDPERQDKYVSLKENLQKARMYITVEKWLSVSLFASIIATVCISLVMLMLKILFSFTITYTKPKFAFAFTGVDVLIFVLGAGLGFLFTFLAFYYYPLVNAWGRRRKIDGVLPYAVGYIASMAVIGVIPYEIFKKLSESEEEYKEVSIEAKQIVRDVELFGFDFIVALRNLASTTASQNLSAFLQGAVTTTLSGGELRLYFINKEKEYMAESRKEQEDFITLLGMIAEMYVVGLVATPLFVIVMYTTMLMLEGASPVILIVIIYGMIPLGSIAFIMLTDVLTPEGAK